MSDRFSLLILPGDGIGPEVMAEVRKVIAWFGKRRGLVFDVDEDLVGGAAYDAQAEKLKGMFRENFKRFEAGVDPKVTESMPNPDA